MEAARGEATWAMNRECRWPLKAREEKEAYFSLETPEKLIPVNNLSLVLLRLTSDFSSSEL